MNDLLLLAAEQSSNETSWPEVVLLLGVLGFMAFFVWVLFR